MILTLSLLKDGEAQDVFDSIQKLACVSKFCIGKKLIMCMSIDTNDFLSGSIDQLYAYSYQPREPFSATNGWKIYDPIKEYERMGVDKSTDMWRFTPINQDYKVLIIQLFAYSILSNTL